MVKRDELPPAGAYQLVIFDNADVAGVLGYHYLTIEGLPLGKVFMDRSQGDFLTRGLSHEILEMLADPDINTFKRHGTDWYMVEICDPVNAWWYLTPNGTIVSDFVTPEWFEWWTGSAPFSYLQAARSPGHLAFGGYIPIVRDGSYMTLQASAEGRPDHPALGAALSGPEPRVGGRREMRKRILSGQELTRSTGA